MHRPAATAAAATAVGLALLLNFKTPTRDTTSASAVASSTSGAGGSGTTSSGGSGSGSSSSGLGGDTATTTGGDGGTQTVTGPVESNRWGNVQVQVTVDNGQITDVSLVQLPSSHGRSVEINDRAVPILVQETLSAQNSQIDMVSGATDTSQGYIASLQGALDALGR